MKTDLGRYKNIGDYAPIVLVIMFLIALAAPLSKHKPWTKIGTFVEKVTSKEATGN